MQRSRSLFAKLAALLLLAPTLVASFSGFQPYILGSPQAGTGIDSATLQKKLASAGFDVLGSYSPAKNYETIAFTHHDLKKEAAAAAVPIGAVLRASLVQNEGKTELSYCSPHYWAFATGLKGTASDALAKKLAEALGDEGGFGCAKGKSESALRKYQYAPFMPTVTDTETLGKFGSFAEAAEAVSKGVSASEKIKQVYSLDLDGSTRIVGMAILDSSGADSTVLGVTDGGKGPKLGGMYGPYELFIKGGEVKTTKGKFRIAIAFPDLAMSTFMRIVNAPGAISDSLKTATAQCAAK